MHAKQSVKQSGRKCLETKEEEAAPRPLITLQDV